MKFTRKANAKWTGSLKRGKGMLTTESLTLNKSQYSYKTRFQNGNGTNPEELIAAAFSGCFTMQLNFLLDKAGFTPDILETEAKATFEDGIISNIHLKVNGKVDRINVNEFKKEALKAKETCPIGKLLNTKITVSASITKKNLDSIK